MPNRSPGDVSARTIQDLGLPGRAVAALTRAGVTSVEDLAMLTRRELAAVPGVGPGMIAAIRLIVPEPPTSLARSAGSPDADGGNRPFPERRPDPDPAAEESPTAPTMPSFDSLRAPKRRSAVDLLVPEQPPAPSPPADAPAAAPRPAEYADLLRFSLRMVRAAAGVPPRVARWAIREQAHCLRRLLHG
jgi:Bacterial RNA polymerase, alpha chain C terminal domain